MAPRSLRLLPFLVPTFLFVGGAPRAAAEGPVVDTKRFPRLTHLLLLPEEQALLKDLTDDKDRREFQKIFWARRDPTPGTPANEFEDNVRAVWKHADGLFEYPNQKGSETGCGQVLVLLGRPEEVRGKGDVPRQPSVDVTGREGRELPAAPGPGRPFDNMAYLREGSTREPETWVYRDRPGLPYHFTGAELKVAFDSAARGKSVRGTARSARAAQLMPGLAAAAAASGTRRPSLPRL